MKEWCSMRKWWRRHFGISCLQSCSCLCIHFVMKVTTAESCPFRALHCPCEGELWYSKQSPVSGKAWKPFIPPLRYTQTWHSLNPQWNKSTFRITIDPIKMLTISAFLWLPQSTFKDKYSYFAFFSSHTGAWVRSCFCWIYQIGCL